MVAIASYINPTGSKGAWDRLIGYPNNKMPILCANVVNGPGAKPADEDWQDVINRAAGSGKIVLGYVRTGYLGLSDDHYTTRLGSTNLADWAAQIQEDVDAWYDIYGSSIGGIFFDEGWPGCGSSSTSSEYHDLYKWINDYTKRNHPGAYTVLNPGSPCDECFKDTMDTLLTFELSYTAYKSSYTPNKWNATDARKLWHIVYNVPRSAINEVATLARQRGAGFLQITDEDMPNPYDILPDDDYMQAQLLQASGGTVKTDPASTWPAGEAVGSVGSLNVGFFDYSSANMIWSGVTGAFGYNIYVNGRLGASVPGKMTSITIGGLQPGSSNSVYVKAIGGGGVEGGQSPTASVSTTALPDGKSVSNPSYTVSGGSSTYQADVLIPYAFVRLFIWDLVDCKLESHPAWPINFGDKGHYVCTQYMVEGTKLYKYTGVILPGQNAPFTFTKVADITRTISGYTYKWTLPYGSDTFDASRYLVQGQGYNPSINLIQPGTEAYDCKGSSGCGPGLTPACVAAAANISRSDTYHYTNLGGADQTGVCAPSVDNGGYGCGIFVQSFNGAQCILTGNQLYSGYEQIREFGSCDTCGSYHRPDGCLITINYVTGCYP
ncbi:hypothetical protein BR93DRAFT_888140 [Coniochaeta sp. PMI_546]|nr:hypothetical protein BR93DRAFT_888140 [Coniochaeta sp. PMI_546]